MEEITPIQKEQLLNWSIQRDALLGEISVLKESKNKIIEQYKNGGVPEEAITKIISPEEVTLTNTKEALLRDVTELTEKLRITNLDLKNRENVLSDIEELKREQSHLISENTKLTDAILKKSNPEKDNLETEIASLKDQKYKLAKQLLEMAETHTEISDNIIASKARLEELAKKEKEFVEMITIDSAFKVGQKSRLEVEVSSLKKEIEVLTPRKNKIKEDIDFLINVQEKVFNRASIMEKVVDNVTRVNSLNMGELESSVNLLKSKIEEILKLSNEDLQAHKNVLDEIPRLFVELRRKSLIREKIK